MARDTGRGAGSQGRWSPLLACALVWAPWAAAHAQAPLVSGTGDCPSATAVETLVADTLPDSLLDGLRSRAESQATLVDRGAHFTVELGGQRRLFEDERRDCRERARMAAVFVALTLRAQAAAPAPPPAPSAPPSPPPPPPPAPPASWPLRVGLGAGGEVAAGRATAIAQLGLALEWRQNADVLLHVAATLPEERSEFGIPLRESRRYAMLGLGWRGGGTRVGLLAEAGLLGVHWAVEPRLSLPRAQTGSALALGGYAALRLHLALTRRLWLGAALLARGFPHAPRLRFAPEVSAATPHVFAGAELNLGLRL